MNELFDFIKVLFYCIGIPIMVVGLILITLFGISLLMDKPKSKPNEYKKEWQFPVKEVCHDGVVYLYNDVNLTGGLTPKVNLQGEFQSCK